MALVLCQQSGADILSTALLAFPAQTESVEYDNLAALRSLPNYAVLRERFAGKPLEEVKASLGKLGIDETQVREIVIGVSPGAFYGLVAGTFSGSLAAKTAQKKGMMPYKAGDAQIFCPKSGACVTFLEDSLAGFGTLDHLKTMLEARQGFVARLGSNQRLVYLINKTDKRAPVRGVVYGSQLKTVLADAVQDESGLNLDWSRFAENIRAFGYSVNMDSRAHVSATLECTSTTTAALLRQMLGAMGNLQSVAAHAGRDAASMPFQNMHIEGSGEVIELKMDTPIPTS